MEYTLPDFFKESLNEEQAAMLERICDTYKEIPVLMLFEQVVARFEEIKEAAKTSDIINLPMAEAIFVALKAITEKHKTVHREQRYWLVGALGYFIADDDEVSDFDSESGFMDDLEIVNTCLKYAELDDLVIDPFDY